MLSIHKDLPLIHNSVFSRAWGGTSSTPPPLRFKKAFYPCIIMQKATICSTKKLIFPPNFKILYRMNALKCRTLATKMLLGTHTPQHKPSHKSIMCGRSFLISSDSYLFRTYEFTDETPQIAEEQLFYDDGQSPRNKASKIQKLAFRLTSAKAKKFQDGDRSTRLYTAISLQLRLFFENRHNPLSEGPTLFPAMGSTTSETKLSPRLRRNRHTNPIAITLRLRSG